MRVFLSVDIEGVAGISHWDEAFKSRADYGPFQQQMIDEAAGACRGALAAGATSILVKDAHGSGRNIRGSALPREAELISGWSGHPFSMVQGLDESFYAAAFIGYHAKAGDGGNPLSHTMSGDIQRISINGRAVAEYHVNAYTAATVGVPVVFVSGDRRLCEDIAETQPATATFATKWGEGASQHSVHPAVAVESIEAGVADALAGDMTAALLEVPDEFVLEVEYTHHAKAYANSFYPGATLVDTLRVRLETDNYFEVLQAITFIL